jgi:hypothetical protein
MSFDTMTLDLCCTGTYWLQKPLPARQRAACMLQNKMPARQTRAAKNYLQIITIENI